MEEFVRILCARWLRRNGKSGNKKYQFGRERGSVALDWQDNTPTYVMRDSSIRVSAVKVGVSIIADCSPQEMSPSAANLRHAAPIPPPHYQVAGILVNVVASHVPGAR